jgi:hypothetical protein
MLDVFILVLYFDKMGLEMLGKIKIFSYLMKMK